MYSHMLSSSCVGSVCICVNDDPHKHTNTFIYAYLSHSRCFPSRILMMEAEDGWSSSAPCCPSAVWWRQRTGGAAPPPAVRLLCDGGRGRVEQLRPLLVDIILIRQQQNTGELQRAAQSGHEGSVCSAEASHLWETNREKINRGVRLDPTRTFSSE